VMMDACVQVVEFVFTTFNVVLFALDVEVLHVGRNFSHRKVLLHPKGHVIQPDDIGLVIAWDLHTAYAISKFEDKHLRKGILQKWPRSKPEVESVELQKFRTGPIIADNRDLQGVGGDLNPIVFPNSPDGRIKLETKLRSAICYTYDNNPEKDDSVELGTFPGWDNHSVGSSSGRSSGDGSYPKGMSLEKATEILLSWPPLPHHGQPHPAVLERRADVILQNLQQRTIQVVELKVPHILVCLQCSWPQHIYYFLRELRKPGFPNPPIVILYPDEPNANQWGKVGIFEDTFFLKGSALYELDLMRGGILQAGLTL
jgi:hypothetical protein